MSEKIRLGNGSNVFACCGGVAFHVGSWHKEMDDEKKREQAFFARWRKSQEERRRACIGSPIKSVSSDASGFKVTLENGASIVGDLTGRELDGHFDRSDQSLSVEYRAPGETDAWKSFCAKEKVR